VTLARRWPPDHSGATAVGTAGASLYEFDPTDPTGVADGPLRVHEKYIGKGVEVARFHTANSVSMALQRVLG
jgi:hypothetical protein